MASSLWRRMVELLPPTSPILLVPSLCSTLGKNERKASAQSAQSTLAYSDSNVFAHHPLSKLHWRMKHEVEYSAEHRMLTIALTIALTQL